MVYVALLRGINVGGNARVEMPRLKKLLESLGYTNVVTYINSGNAIFESDAANGAELGRDIELAIKKEFSLEVPVVVRSKQAIEAVCENLPDEWQNNKDMKCDVLFLWQEVDSPDVLKQLAVKPEIEDVLYIPGAVLWRVDRVNINRGSMVKIIGTKLYKQVTLRNCNTVRKLQELMERS